MNLQVSNTTVSVSNTYYYKSSGAPNLGMLVILFRITGGTLTEVGRCITNVSGTFLIEIPIAQMLTGDYEIRTYGSNTISRYIPDGDWEKFHFDNPGDPTTGIQDLVFASLPTFQVTESVNDEDKFVNADVTEQSSAIITIGNLSILEGRLATVVVEYKQPGSLTYTVFDVFPVNGDIESISLTFKSKITFYQKPYSMYDFRCTFQGANGEYGVYNETIVSLTDLNVQFDGVSDLPEYIEVGDLEVTNATNLEDGILPDIFAELQWEEIRNIPRVQMPTGRIDGYRGDPYSVTFDQAQKIAGYGLWMYVTSGIAPANHYPVTVSGEEGDWYYVGEFEKANAKVRCPSNYKIAFWAGMRSLNTASNIQKKYYKF